MLPMAGRDALESLSPATDSAGSRIVNGEQRTRWQTHGSDQQPLHAVRHTPCTSGSHEAPWVGFCAVGRQCLRPVH